MFNQTINRSVENIARFDMDTHLTPPLTKYNAVMEFVLSTATENRTQISANFVFPTKIKDAVGIKDPKIKVSRKIVFSAIRILGTVSSFIYTRYNDFNFK